VSIIYCRL